MEHPVTQRQIAEELGLEVTTVSKALRNHPKIARRTRERVAEVAARLGYRRDPMLSALASYRQRQRGPAFRATLAWVYNHARSARMERFAAYGRYLEGARMRAEELGYAIEEFWCGSGQNGASRLGGILRARGISGVIVAPQEVPGCTLNLPWEELSAVAIGYSLTAPALHTVTNDHFQTITTLLEQLEERGRRRVGLYVWAEDNRRQQRRALAAVAAWNANRRVPVLEYDQADAETFLAWQKRHRLDAVVTRHGAVPQWLARAGRDDVLCASYALDGAGDVGWPGMDHNNRIIGMSAVDWLTRLVERGETGLPAVPLRMLVMGTWRDA